MDHLKCFAIAELYRIWYRFDVDQCINMTILIIREPNTYVRLWYNKWLVLIKVF